MRPWWRGLRRQAHVPPHLPPAICIEVQDDAGRALVDEHLAQQVLQDIPKRPPQRSAVAIANGGWTASAGLPMEEIKTRTAPQAWLCSGPLPTGSDDPPPAWAA